ncbi:MAG: tRNA (adenosine(37)-N6)-dimethylallyltransferase MiaA [Clostridia bacterium]|nr:tRNA (adenosine(37)-N6)-dimethylallyltransferase MiaA [Clostridia bacterium]
MKIAIIYGPTAVGKSDIAVMLAKKIDAEVISADSMQIYQDLDIGTAKVTQQEMQNIPHHLLNIKNSSQTYSVFEFVEDCKKCIKDIQSRGKNVVIVGGTGLYITALTENYNYASVDKNNKLRQQLNNCSCEELVKKLENLNITVKNDDKNNKQRLIRYYEIYLSNGVMQKSEFDDSYIIFGLLDDREKLYDRINKRVDIMVQNGLLEEARYVINNANLENQCLKAIGYKELIPYLNGEDSLENCINILKQRSRNYAKRQITFMNQFKNIKKVQVSTKQETAEYLYNVLLNK